MAGAGDDVAEVDLVRWLHLTQLQGHVVDGRITLEPEHPDWDVPEGLPPAPGPVDFIVPTDFGSSASVDLKTLRVPELRVVTEADLLVISSWRTDELTVVAANGQRLAVQLKSAVDFIEFDATLIGLEIDCHPKPIIRLHSTTTLTTTGGKASGVVLLDGQLRGGSDVHTELVAAGEQAAGEIRLGPKASCTVHGSDQGQVPVSYVLGEEAHFALRGFGAISMPEGELRHFRLEAGSTLHVESDETSRGLLAKGVGTVVVAGRVDGLHLEPGLLDEAAYRFEPRIDLHLGPWGRAQGVSGDFVLRAEPGAALVGAAERECSVKRIDAAEGAELEHISLYALTAGDLPALRLTERLVPQWTEQAQGARSEAVRRAMAMSEDATIVAHFWTSISQILHEQGAPGSAKAIAHEVAMETRRHAARGLERVLLEGSRLFGHGARIGRPIAVWLGSSAIAALILGLLSGQLDTDGVPAHEYLSLLLDTIASPVTLVRALPIDDAFTTAVDAAGAPGRLIALVVRIVGALSLVFIVLAARRVGRSE